MGTAEMSQPDAASERRVEITLGGDGIAHVRLSRADKLNALDAAMFDALIAAGEELAAMAELRCVVLSGEGRGFCAGIDLAMLAPLADGKLNLADRSHGSANRFQQVAMQWRALAV